MSTISVRVILLQIDTLALCEDEIFWTVSEYLNPWVHIGGREPVTCVVLQNEQRHLNKTQKHKPGHPKERQIIHNTQKQGKDK